MDWQHQCLFLAKNVKGGVIVEYYKISDITTINESTVVPLQFDYRQIYTTILQKWFGVCKDDATNVLKKDIEPLEGIIKDDVVITPCIMGALVDPTENKCIVSIIDINGDDHNLYARIQPNPTSGLFNIEPVIGFDYSLPITITSHTVNGILLFKKKNIYQENEKISIDMEVSSGIYKVGIQNNKYKINQKLSIQK